MRKIAADSRALRQLAEELLDEIAEDEEIFEGAWEDLATSLVRQWVSYDGNATLFLGGRQVYLVLGMRESALDACTHALGMKPNSEDAQQCVQDARKKPESSEAKPAGGR